MRNAGILIAVLLLSCPLSAPAQENRAQETRAAPAANPAESIHYGWADVLRVDPVYDDAGPPPVLRLSIPRDGDHQGVLDPFHPAEPLRDLVAVHSRKSDVQEDDLRSERSGGLQCGGAVCGGKHFVAPE